MSRTKEQVIPQEFDYTNDPYEAYEEYAAYNRMLYDDKESHLDWFTRNEKGLMSRFIHGDMDLLLKFGKYCENLYKEHCDHTSRTVVKEKYMLSKTEEKKDEHPKNIQ